MKIKYWHGWYFVILCLMIACREKEQECFVPDKIIEMTKIDDHIEKIMDTVTYLPLEISENATLSKVHKLLADDSLYFLADFNYSKIAVYTHQGKLKYVLNKRGHGLGEYLEIRNFTVDESRIYTIDNFQNKINIYDKNTGRYIESKPTDVIASDIISFGKDCFLLTAIPNGQTWAMEQSKEMTFMTDRNFKVTNRFFSYEKGYCEPLSRYFYFSSTDSSVIFSSFRFDGCTEIMKSEKQDTRSILMQLRKPIPNELRTKIESYENSSTYEFVAQTPIICKKYWFIEVTHDGKSECYVYDWLTGKLYGNDEQAVDKMAFIVGSDSKHFISYVPDKAYYNELVKYGLHKADSLTETYLQQGGSALVLYGMK